MAVQGLGHGYDWLDQPAIQQRSPMDYFMKWVEVVPMRLVASKHVISFVKEHIIHRFGIPQTITTDGGSVFISE